MLNSNQICLVSGQVNLNLNVVAGRAGSFLINNAKFTLMTKTFADGILF